MRILGILSFCALGFTATAVAARMIWLWRRTRQLPELLFGAGLLSMGALGLPISAAGRMPGMVRTELGDHLAGLPSGCPLGAGGEKGSQQVCGVVAGERAHGCSTTGVLSGLAMECVSGARAASDSSTTSRPARTVRRYPPRRRRSM